jgi:glycosyltransferase involved in cell wall biosynthesis
MADVAVLMAVYNGMPFLPEAIESILEQTFKQWEFVIVDDGSTDATADYLDRLQDQRVRVIHTQNSGLGPALNRGLAECHTEFVARMDGDDVAYPTRLERQVAFLRERPEVGLVGTQIERMGINRGAGQSLLPTGHEAILEHLMNGLPAMYHPTIMCRTESLRHIGGYWELPFGEESDMFLRMAEVAKLANLDRVLLSYRFDSGSMTGANMSAMRSHVEYAIDCARRRQSGLPAIQYQDFEATQRSAPWWKRARRALDIYARRQYRLAVADLLGSRRMLGYLRLGWAATCSPGLTRQRIARVLTDRRPEPAEHVGIETSLDGSP